MTRRPDWSFAHREPPRLGDSPQGMAWAAEHHFLWADVNVLLTADLVAVAAHGAPYGLAQQGFLPAGDHRRVRDLTAAQIAQLRSPDGYRVPTLAQMFQAARDHHVRLEPEAKMDHRFTRQDVWATIAADARRTWGRSWSDHVVPKVLTNLHPGGLAFALGVCDAAHAEGFQTMILPRDRDRFRRLGGPSITYNRGGLIGRRNRH